MYSSTRKGQGSTEYLVLLAIVLVVAGVVVYLLGFFPGLTGGISEDQSKIYWKSITPISIIDYTIASGTGLAQVDMQNTLNEDVSITSISFDGNALTGLTNANLTAGQRKTISGTIPSGVRCTGPGTQFSYRVVITYNTKNLLGKQEQGDKELVGKCT
ncbi:Class III signal peptide [Candidatus Gugararchaeum adminiculabundum]|nr:Class III signal peptide [Candidatus Gugararchaeum adminiculabundum]